MDKEKIKWNRWNRWNWWCSEFVEERWWVLRDIYLYISLFCFPFALEFWVLYKTVLNHNCSNKICCGESAVLSVFCGVWLWMPHKADKFPIHIYKGVLFIWSKAEFVVCVLLEISQVVDYEWAIWKKKHNDDIWRHIGYAYRFANKLQAKLKGCIKKKMHFMINFMLLLFHLHLIIFYMLILKRKR